MSRRLALASAAAVSVAGAVALLASRGDGSLRRVLRAGRWRMGYAVESPYADVSAGGRVIGESPESLAAVARRAGLPPPSPVQVAFDDLIPGLEAHRFDVVAAGMFITAARRQRVSFSQPTLRVRPGWLVRRQGAPALGAYRDAARQTSLRVAALRGSVEQTRLAQAGLAPGRLVEVPDAQAGLASVAAGQVDALALSLPAVRQLAARQPAQLAAVAATGGAGDEQGDLVGFAFHRDDTDLREAVDHALDGWVGSTEHLTVLRRHGFDVGDLPPPRTQSPETAR